MRGWPPSYDPREACTDATTDLSGLRVEACRLRDEGSLDEAEAVAERAVLAWPGDREALFLLGDIRYRAGRWTRALEVYERLVADRPDGENGWYNRGLCLAKLGDAAAARSDFDRYVERCPDDADGWEWRGLVKLDLGDRAGADADFCRAMELDPGRRERLAGRTGESAPGEPAGREVLRACGELVVALLVFGGVLALLFLVVLPFAGEHDTAGTVLMILSTVALLVVGVWAVARKKTFILLFFPWLFEGLLSMRRGRRLVGGLILAGGVWMAWGLLGIWWTHGVELTGRRIKEAVLAVGFVLMVLGFGAVLLVTDGDEAATGTGRR